jgi:glycylpeptide N-tetradecanoyltransferase
MSLSEQRIKEIEMSLPTIKLTGDDKIALTEIIDSTPDQMEQTKKIRDFLVTLENRTKTYQSKRELKKVQTLYDTHDFWETQPVPKNTDVVNPTDYDRPIDAEKKVDDIDAEPLPIPASFYWANVNIEDDAECQEVYDLLT